MSNSNVTIAKNTLFLSLRMVFILVVSLYTSRVFLNALGVVDYGISNIVAGFVSMFSFLNTSLSNAIQRFYNSELGKNGAIGVTKVYNVSLRIQTIIAICVFILLETIGLWYMYEKMVIPAERFNTAFWIYHFSVISAVIVIMQSPYVAAVMAHEKMQTYALISSLDVVFKLIFALILPYINSDRLLMYGAFFLIITILNFVLYYIYSKRNFRDLYLVRNFDKGMVKEMVSFSGWNFFGTFACVAREQGLNLILNLFFGPIVNAARGIAYQVSGALQSFVSNLSLAAKPQMVQSFATGDSNRTINLMYVMSKLSFIFLYILSVPVLLNIDYVLHLWLGDVVPKHSANFIVLVILTNFFNNLNAPLSNVVYATGKMKKYELTFSIINLLIIPIAFIALKLGAMPEAAFIVYLIMSIFVQIGCLLVVRTIVTLSLRQYVKKILLPIIAVVVTTFPLIYGIHIVLPCSVVSIVAEYVIMTIFATIAFYFLVLDSTEKSFVKNILQKILKK